MARNDDLFMDTRQSQHNHLTRGIMPEGECPRCDEWWRWHNKTASNPTPTDVVIGSGKKRGRPKKTQNSEEE